MAIALVALVALAGTAIADNFAGKTSQGQFARVKTNEFEVPELLVVRWKAPCGRDNLQYIAKTVNGGPFRSQSRNHFRGWERHRNNDLRDGYRSVVLTKYRGTRVGNRWTGTFQAWVQLKQGGTTYTHCRTGELRFTTRATG